MGDLKSDIEKYLKGQLGPQEMHALEKKALNDPFLAEALEGAASVQSEDFLTDVSDLEQRIQKATARRTWIGPLRIAAAIALLLLVSFGIYTFIKPDKPITLAQNTPKETQAPAKESGPGDTVSKSEEEKSLLSLDREPPAQPQEKSTEKAKPISVPVPSSVASGASTEKKEREGDVSHRPAVKELAAAKPEEVLTEQASDKIKAAEEESARSKRKDDVAQKEFRFNVPSGVAAGPTLQKVIKGKVTASEDNSPIPGVNVLVKGTAQGAVSDVNGNYQLVTDSLANDLVFSSIGYASTDVKLPAGQSQIDVQLSADVMQLNEVVVTGFGFAKKEDDSELAPIQLAEPQGGRRAYKKYLDNNLQYPQAALDQKIEGKVTLEFTVQTGGELADFDILHGLAAGCNDEVIRLVKEGPRWRPSFQADVALESRVRIGVRFKLPKK